MRDFYNILNALSENNMKFPQFRKAIIQAGAKRLEALTLSSEGNLVATYATLLKGPRIPEWEPYILHSVMGALHYALHVLHHRWPEAEPMFKRHLASGQFTWVFNPDSSWGEYAAYLGIHNKYDFQAWANGEFTPEKDLNK